MIIRRSETKGTLQNCPYFILEANSRLWWERGTQKKLHRLNKERYWNYCLRRLRRPELVGHSAGEKGAVQRKKLSNWHRNLLKVLNTKLCFLGWNFKRSTEEQLERKNQFQGSYQLNNSLTVETLFSNQGILQTPESSCLSSEGKLALE